MGGNFSIGYGLVGSNMISNINFGGDYKIRNGDADGLSSLGKFDSKKSFGAAFRAAHSEGGRGHTFTYNNKLYNTNCKDGGDYRKVQDTRSNFNHSIRQRYHDVNVTIKDNTGSHILDYATCRRKLWTADVDRQRSEYHRREILKNRK